MRKSLDVSRNSIGSLGKAALGVAMVRSITPPSLPPAMLYDEIDGALEDDIGDRRPQRCWPDLQNLVCDEWATGHYIRETNELDSRGLAPLPGSGAVMAELLSSEYEDQDASRFGSDINDDGKEGNGEDAVENSEGDLDDVNHGDKKSRVYTDKNIEVTAAAAAAAAAVESDALGEEKSEERGDGYQRVPSALSKGGLVLDLTDRGLKSSDLLLLSGALMRHRCVFFLYF